MNEIAEIIKKRGLKAADCGYHTLRALDNNGRIRALLVKGDTVLHIEYTCPFCGHTAYKTQEWKPVSKAAQYKFSTTCDKCGEAIKVAKLKGGKKKKGPEVP